jgi:mono/diheme cytochrome c family protein
MIRSRSTLPSGVLSYSRHLLFGACLCATLGCGKDLSQAELRGQSVYTVNCYDCHEGNQLGLVKEPPKLHRLFSKRYLPDGTTPATDEAVRSVIIAGKRTMPAFNLRLTEQQLSDLVRYLHRK